MVSGRGGDVHLFVCLRPVSRVPPAVATLAAGKPQADMVLIRSTIRGEDGKLACVAPDVTQAGPSLLLAAGVPVIASVSMRSLASSGLRGEWAPLLRPETPLSGQSRFVTHRKTRSAWQTARWLSSWMRAERSMWLWVTRST
jgi:hypothetical protein